MQLGDRIVLQTLGDLESFVIVPTNVAPIDLALYSSCRLSSSPFFDVDVFSAFCSLRRGVSSELLLLLLPSFF